MSVVSAGKAGPGNIVPGRQGGPRKRRRFDTPFALGMAAGVLINVALFMALYFRADPEVMKPQPRAIPVELVKQPPPAKPQAKQKAQEKAQKQAKPQPKPEQPKQEKPKAEQPKIDTKYMRSGGNSQDEPQGAPDTGSPDVKEKLKKAEKQPQKAEKEKPKKEAEKKERGAKEKHEEPIGPLPSWARHVTQGFGSMEASRASRGAAASGAVGGGNLYLNKMRDKISKQLSKMDVPLPQHAAQYAITVLRDGRVSDVKLTESSGSKAFDEAGYVSIIRSSPFAPLPAYIDGDYVEITFTFRPQ